MNAYGTDNRNPEIESIRIWNERGVCPGPDLTYLLARIMELEERMARYEARDEPEDPRDPEYWDQRGNPKGWPFR